jgi:hypothetical protein
MKKLLLPLLTFVIFAFFAYIIFILFIISGDTKNYENSCSKYIKPLNDYKQSHNNYPTRDEAKRLNLNFEYSLEECGYNIANDNKDEFHFYVSEGLGVAGYDSTKNKWWHD